MPCKLPSIWWKRAWWGLRVDTFLTRVWPLMAGKAIDHKIDMACCLAAARNYQLVRLIVGHNLRLEAVLVCNLGIYDHGKW